MNNRNSLDNYEKRLLKEIMNIMIPANQELLAAGDKCLVKELETLFFDSITHRKSIFKILDSIKLNIDVRMNGSFFSLEKKRKIEILKWLEKNMFDEFVILKESIFLTYYNDKEVIEKIEWDKDFINKNENLQIEWDKKVISKVSKLKPFWKKI